MSVYKRMKLACCFDCGRSERDCSCMSGSVHSNMDTLQRAYPLSSVSVHDCATTLRACKLQPPNHMLLSVCGVCSVYPAMQRYRTCCLYNCVYVCVCMCASGVSTWCHSLPRLCRCGFKTISLSLYLYIYLSISLNGRITNHAVKRFILVFVPIQLCSRS